jgi:uncharacterized DUF497 family protein
MPYKDEDFEWDERKAKANLQKHGISFATARSVFVDEFRISYLDDRLDYGEEREITIGKAQDHLVAVVHTDRNGKIRIISARNAEPAEARSYYQLYPESR